jgi:hypothetical protein
VDNHDQPSRLVADLEMQHIRNDDSIEPVEEQNFVGENQFKGQVAKC